MLEKFSGKCHKIFRGKADLYWCTARGKHRGSTLTTVAHERPFFCQSDFSSYEPCTILSEKVLPALKNSSKFNQIRHNALIFIALTTLLP